MQIKGKRVLVTGGAVRIGREITKALACQGAEVLIHCRNSNTEAEELLEQLDGNDHKIVLQDLARINELPAFFDSLGPIDALINNASMYKVVPMEDEDISLADLQFKVNYTAPVELMKLFRNQKARGGVIINLLDQNICKTTSPGGSYIQSKKALAEATLDAALNWAPEIRVNGIAPGPVLPPVGLNGEGMKKVLANVPLGRPVDMNDLIESVLFLIKNESVSGQIIYADCGQHLNG